MFALLGDYRKLVVHVRNLHNKTVREYKSVHDNLNIKDKVRHHCKICSKDILYTWDHLQRHLATHHAGMTVEEYDDTYLVLQSAGEGGLEVRYSDTPYDYCIYGCQECNFKGNLCHVLKVQDWKLLNEFNLKL